MNAQRSSGTDAAPERPVPLLDLHRQNAPLREAYLEALARVLDSGAFVLGPEVERLERRLAEYCGCPHAVACASGSDALLLALMALDVQTGDEVIVPSFTFFATASAITRLGATPVFADLDPITCNVAPDHVARLIGPKTKAVIPVHLFGQSADMDALRSITAAHDIPLIEDAAQGIGAEWKGRRVGSMGEMGCFSFYPTKNLGAAGDAGMLTTGDEALAERLRALRLHGMTTRYYHPFVGINSRLDTFQAAILNVKLDHLDDWINERNALAQRYCRLFADADVGETVVLPRHANPGRHVWNQFVVRVRGGRRDDLRAFLRERAIGSEIYYPLGLHEQECFAYLGYAPTDLPETFAASREVLALPIFPGLTEEEQATVVNAFAEFFQKSTRPQVAPPMFLSRSGRRAPRSAPEPHS